MLWGDETWVFCYTGNMPFLPDLLTKLKNMGAAAAGFFTGLAGKVSRCFTRIREHGLGGKIFQGRKRFIFIGLGLLCILLLFGLIAAWLVMNHNADTGFQAAGDGREPPRGPPVPPEELFLPAEPDFLPGVMLEREQRQSWTREDAEPYWQNPLKNGEEPWRDQVEAVIDELLERVP
jgi:hypothetical protein